MTWLQAVFQAGLYDYWQKKNVANSTACDNMPSTYTVTEPLSWENLWAVKEKPSDLDMKLLISLTLASFVSLLGFKSNAGEIPMPKETEALQRSSEALHDLLKLTTKERCSVFLITDGTLSSDSVSQVLKVLSPEFGVHLYEVIFQTANQNKSQQQLSDIINFVTKIRMSYECVSVAAFSDNITFLDMFAGAHKFDLLSIWKDRPIVVTSLSRKQLNDLLQRHWVLFAGNAKVLQVPTSERGKSLFKIYTHLPYGPEEGGGVIRIATWSKHSGMVEMPYIDTFPAKYREFKVPVQATVTVAEWSAHVTAKKDAKTGKILIGGSMAKVVYALAASLNFTFKLVEPEDGQWGSKNADGSWTGLVGQVHRHEADFAIGPHDLSEVRSQSIDFTIPLIFAARKFIVAQRQAHFNPWGFLYPLSAMVWLLTFVSLCAVTIMAAVIGWKDKKDPSLFYIPDVAFRAYSVIIQQGLTMEFIAISERVVVVSWLLGSMIIYWSYGTSLMSLLAVRYAPRPIQTIRDVLDDNKITVVFPYRTALSDYLFSVESGQLKEVADLIKVGRYMEVQWWEYYKLLETHVSLGTYVLAIDIMDAGDMIAQYFSEKGPPEENQHGLPVQMPCHGMPLFLHQYDRNEIFQEDLLPWSGRYHPYPCQEHPQYRNNTKGYNS
ncbi:uncharacterized protein [Macrobrachium rosenbergii]|uniref:uncharacterized protein n=1 Tax=Macrobrachium rosenbergii TaxID=79674 RepID=UPI0034D68995